MCPVPSRQMMITDFPPSSPSRTHAIQSVIEAKGECQTEYVERMRQTERLAVSIARKEIRLCDCRGRDRVRAMLLDLVVPDDYKAFRVGDDDVVDVGTTLAFSQPV